MRICDVMLSFPAILVALLIAGVGHVLFSGEWWITIFPGVMLVLIALSVNLLGDWLRDALNPRPR